LSIAKPRRRREAKKSDPNVVVDVAVSFVAGGADGLAEGPAPAGRRRRDSPPDRGSRPCPRRTRHAPSRGGAVGRGLADGPGARGALSGTSAPFNRPIRPGTALATEEPSSAPLPPVPPPRDVRARRSAPGTRASPGRGRPPRYRAARSPYPGPARR